MKKTPLVSVLMTSFNRSEFISEAICSVLNSTFSDFELIISDDASTDETYEIAHEFAKKDSRILLFRNSENLGDYLNRNKVASYATGEYIKYLDSDDVIYRNSLDTMIHCMKLYPEAGFGLSSVAPSNRALPIVLTPPEIYKEHFDGYGHFGRAPGSSIIKLSAFRNVGGFSGERMIGDFEFWFRIGRVYNMVKMPRDLVWDREHLNQESKSNYAKSMYGKLRSKVISTALDHPDCPLDKIEILRIKNKLKLQKLKESIKKIL